jgi:hypothetical protein
MREVQDTYDHRRVSIFRPRRRLSVLAALAAVGLTVALVPQLGASPRRVKVGVAPQAAVPTVSGPVTGPGSPFLVGFEGYPLSRVGYLESEYFFSGSAHSYTNSSSLGSDGKWSVRTATTAPYKSRLVVVRPVDPRRFSGTVVVEWLNVSAGFDAPPDWVYGHDEMIRSGDVYVGISAQASGVNSLKASNPSRYGTLQHPGDSFSYDIYSQAGIAVRARAAAIMPNLRPRVVIADGESQSAGRMTTYVNAVAPIANVFDAYMIHSRGGGSAALSQAPQAAIATPTVVLTRNDLRVPVVAFETETDVIPFSYVSARQPDSRFFRLWEVAGTAHIDGYNTGGAALSDDGNWDADLQLFSYLSSPPTVVSKPAGLDITISCGGSGFNAGQQHYVFQAALRGLAEWVTRGIPLPQMPRLEVDTAFNPPKFRLDANGNVLGGIRTPAVDAPLAVVSGLPAPGSPGFCNTFGQTIPFTSLKVSELYRTHRDFVRSWRRAVLSALHSGSLLREDAWRLIDVVG